MANLIAWLVAIVAFVAVTLTASIWSGFVVVTLWGWFAVPLGVPAISLPVAVGLTCLVMSLRPQHVSPFDPQHREFIKHALKEAYLKPGWLLLIGWCAHSWVTW